MEVDECLLKLGESIDNTKLNIIFLDNKNFGIIDGRYYDVGSDIASTFQRFASEYMSSMVPEDVHSLTNIFRRIIESERTKMISVYHPQNLTDYRDKQLLLLFNTMKSSVLDELRPIRKAINSNPEAKSCWFDRKQTLCKFINAAGDEIGRILKSEAYKLEEDFGKIASNMERLALIVKSAYKGCADADSEDVIRKCAANRVSF